MKPKLMGRMQRSMREPLSVPLRVALDDGSGGGAPPPPPLYESFTFYDHSTQTGMPKEADSTSYTMGNVYRVDEDGAVDTVYMYKPVGSEQTSREAGVYNASGDLLVRGSLAVDGAEGTWVPVLLDQILEVEAGVDYIPSSNVFEGSYAWDEFAFSSAVVSGPITAPADGTVSGNGRSTASGGFSLSYPGDPYNASSWYTDMRYWPGRPLASFLPTGFPDDGDTGHSGSLTTYSGPETITVDGTVIENMDILTSLLISADNVIIRNCRLYVTSDFGIDGEYAANLLIEDCTVYNDGTLGTNAAILGGLGGSVFQRNNIYGVQNGIVLASNGNDVIIRDNYVHDLASGGADPHFDAVAVQGGQVNVLIEHNTLVSWDTSCIIINEDFGPSTGIVVNNNLMLQQLPNKTAYTMYVYTAGVTVTNNFMSRGQHGYFDIGTVGATFSNNVDAYSRVAIPAS